MENKPKVHTVYENTRYDFQCWVCGVLRCIGLQEGFWGHKLTPRLHICVRRLVMACTGLIHLYSEKMGLGRILGCWMGFDVNKT